MEEKILYTRLVERYTSKKASEQELAVFFKLLAEGKLDETLEAAFMSGGAELAPIEAQRVPGQLHEPDDSSATPNDIPPRAVSKVARFRNYRVWAAVAASLLIIISAAVLLRNSQHTAPSRPTAAVVQQPALPSDIGPGTNRATLILADNSSIRLDSVANGVIATQGSTRIVRIDSGLLAYQPGPAAADLIYNTVKTPRGGQYQVRLPDGSRVWLNAASTLKFPTAFNGAERVVELDGEGYFEIVHRTSAPFRVKLKNGANIDVLGTHFNVHCYNDEPVEATLLQGSVKVQSTQGSAILKPGQEATFQQGGGVSVRKADTEQAVAWKNGLFEFNRAEITTIMRQIERWYDVDVVYAGEKSTKQFVGKVPRNSNLSEVLGILELSNIHFKVEGRKVTVLP